MNSGHIISQQVKRIKITCIEGLKWSYQSLWDFQNRFNYLDFNAFNLMKNDLGATFFKKILLNRCVEIKISYLCIAFERKCNWAMV